MIASSADIPAAWTQALDAIQQIAPAVMAGGCLRDLDNGREVKDIDIFVSDRGARANGLYALREQLIEADLACAEIDESKMYPVGDGNDLIGCIDMEFADCCPPVQIIMVACSLDRILERFDYGICRISFDGTVLVRHPDYIADREAKLFRLRLHRDHQQLSASVHRFARLTRKYEDWRFVPHTSDDGIDDLFA